MARTNDTYLTLAQRVSKRSQIMRICLSASMQTRQRQLLPEQKPTIIQHMNLPTANGWQPRFKPSLCCIEYKNRGVKIGNFHVIRESKCQAALLNLRLSAM
ncbi:hypothetical protein PO124_31875 [Bacillus licheniformis]|nr:hypothetical protein [Bacillus licheniformis]